ncbi:MAG: TldD/PmbA family protein [Planctomycetota bacterium]
MKASLFIIIIIMLAPSFHASGSAFSPATEEDLIIKALAEELDYSMQNLAMPDGTKPYFISYAITDSKTISIRAELGTLNVDDAEHSRTLDVDVRVGDYPLDNTHKIRGDDFSRFARFFITSSADVSLEDNLLAIKQAVWQITDQEFKNAVETYQKVLTNLKTKVEEEDQSADFSKQELRIYFEPEIKSSLNRAAWADRLRKVSALAQNFPLVYNSSVSLSAEVNNQYFVNSEGTRIQTGQTLFRVHVNAETKAEDGMELSQDFLFNASTEEGLPSDEEISKAFQKVIDQVIALRKAPIIEPYIGPAILVNRASAVFFHEIFGHRIEGHRQKDVEEGQTFTKKLGEPILPEFLHVIDDPTLAEFDGEDLRGYYKFDDEGVAAERVVLVENGVLKNFLMSRSPIEGFSKSNGHGRRSPGSKVVSRMGNTMIESSKTVSFDELRQLLIEECDRTQKPYGLLFEDISGGFTGTGRAGAQVFKVLPKVVYKIFADGRPDELVRGVDIVGTPLTCFSQITYTGNDPAVFNGTCGAESGQVPVSGISPSILVAQMEVEKQSRDQDRPPILPPPISEKQGKN